MAEQKKEEKKIEIPENLKNIVKEIEELKVKDLAKLVKVLEEKFGVSAQAAVVAAPAGVGAAAGAAEEKTEFDVMLKSIGPSKIQVIKLVKEITGKGLKESKEMVDASEKSPKALKEKIKKEEAEELKKKLEAAGATAEIK
ncbi:MAG: 50S ribosomal protein L7/L12 [Patescibacteria group bacterium]